MPAFDKVFGFKDDFRISRATECIKTPQPLRTSWKWAYTNQFRESSVEMDRIAKQVDVAQAEIGGEYLVSGD